MQPRTSFQKRGRGSPDPSRGGASDGGGRNRAVRPEVRGWRSHHGPEGARSGFRPRDPEALEGAQGCRRQASGLGLLCVVLSPPVRGDVDSSPGELTWPGKDRGRRTKADAGDRAGLSAKAGPESEPPGETRDRGAGIEPRAGRRVPCSRATADTASRRPRPVPDRLGGRVRTGLSATVGTAARSETGGRSRDSTQRPLPGARHPPAFQSAPRFILPANRADRSPPRVGFRAGGLRLTELRWHFQRHAAGKSQVLHAEAGILHSAAFAAVTCERLLRFARASVSPSVKRDR